MVYCKRSSSIAGDTSIPPDRRKKFDSSELLFLTNHAKTAKRLVLRYHYSHRWPPSSYTSGVFVVGYPPLAVASCTFGNPATRWSEPVVELTRLVRLPNYRVPLTRLISLTIKQLRLDKPDTDLLISYADWTHGHHGGVYQAASWNFHEQRKPSCDGCIVDGTFIPGRTCNARFGTRSPSKLKQQLNCTVEPHYDKGKCLYWKALSHSGKRKAERLNFKKMPYRKLDKEVNKS